jgi:hypothetical protein
MEKLALRAGEALARAAIVSPGEVGPVINTLIAPATMAAWGGRITDRLIQHLGTVAEADPGLAQRLALSVWEFEDQRDEATAIGDSRILGLTSTRKQDLDMARYSTGQKFPEFLAAAPEPALQFLLTVLDRQAPASEPLRTSGQLPHVYLSRNLEFAPGDSALASMATSLVAFVVSLATGQETPDETTLDQLMQNARERLTHHQVWCMLLEAGTAHPESLGRCLLPLLDGSDLLCHFMTSPYAAKLIAALSPILSPAEHACLERAVLDVRQNHPTDPDGERTQALIDGLLGQLDRSRVQNPAVRERLAELDSQGGPPLPPEPRAESGGYTFTRDVSFGWPEEVGVSTETGGPLREAIKRAEADFYGTMSNSVDDQTAARERLRESMPALYSVLTSAEVAAEQADAAHAHDVLTYCAERLAPDTEVLPSTDLGEMVFGLLEAALPVNESPSDAE